MLLQLDISEVKNQNIKSLFNKCVRQVLVNDPEYHNTYSIKIENTNRCLGLMIVATAIKRLFRNNGSDRCNSGKHLVSIVAKFTTDCFGDCCSNR